MRNPALNVFVAIPRTRGQAFFVLLTNTRCPPIVLFETMEAAKLASIIVSGALMVLPTRVAFA